MPRHVAHFPQGSGGVLVLAHGWQDPLATARLVAALHDREPVRIHVAAVQCPPNGYARSFLRSVGVRTLLTNLARDSMAALCAELDALGVPYKTHIEILPWLAGIARLVRDLGCARMVVGVNPRALLRDVALRFDRWLIASALRGEGLPCAVVRGDEARIPGPRRVGAAVPHLP